MKRVRYYIQRLKMRKRNCWNCWFFCRVDGKCFRCGYYFLKYVALVTKCKDWKENTS